jgi:hypothetical protein
MYTPLNGLQTIIVSKRQNGVSVYALSKEYRVSRQAIYNLLKKAEKEGEKIPWNKTKKIKNFCLICNKKGYFKTKTCGKDCSGKLRIKIGIKKDSKWSKHSFVELTCASCGKNFSRTKYQQAISTNKTKKDIKENYCSTECYYNRSLLNSFNRKVDCYE